MLVVTPFHLLGETAYTVFLDVHIITAPVQDAVKTLKKIALGKDPEWQQDKKEEDCFLHRRDHLVTKYV